MGVTARLLGSITVAVLAFNATVTAASAATTLQEGMFVGNNWEGTADVIKSSGTFAKIGRINVAPDRAQRLNEIYLDPIKLAFYLGIQHGPGEGHDQLVDDMYSTPDG